MLALEHKLGMNFEFMLLSCSSSCTRHILCSVCPRAEHVRSIIMNMKVLTWFSCSLTWFSCHGSWTSWWFHVQEHDCWPMVHPRQTVWPVGIASPRRSDCRPRGRAGHPAPFKLNLPLPIFLAILSRQFKYSAFLYGSAMIPILLLAWSSKVKICCHSCWPAVLISTVPVQLTSGLKVSRTQFPFCVMLSAEKKHRLFLKKRMQLHLFTISLRFKKTHWQPYISSSSWRDKIVWKWLNIIAIFQLCSKIIV